MGIGNILLLAQVTAYVLLFLLSFFIVIPAGINQTNFDGNCALFSTGTWHANNQSSSHFQIDVWGDRSVCNFTVYIGIVSMMVSLVLTVRLSIFLCREVDSSFLGAFLTLVVNVFIVVMIFAGSVVYSQGFNFFCRQLVYSKDSHVLRCSDADYMEWSADPKLNTSGLIMQFGITQFGMWASWVCWVAVVVMSVIKLWKHTQHETFLRSMQRERDRLFGNYSQSEII